MLERVLFIFLYFHIPRFNGNEGCVHPKAKSVIRASLISQKEMY